MKALFHDWNDLTEPDGRVLAYRADPAWPMPEVGEVIAVGSEDCFFEAQVDELRSDVFALVKVDKSGPIGVPLGWPLDSLIDGCIEEGNRARRYYRALKEIGDNLSPEPGTFNPGHFSWQAKIAREALVCADGSSPWNRP